jgi:hypothetical protein
MILPCPTFQHQHHFMNYANRLFRPLLLLTSLSTFFVLSFLAYCSDYIYRLQVECESVVCFKIDFPFVSIFRNLFHMKERYLTSSHRRASFRLYIVMQSLTVFSVSFLLLELHWIPFLIVQVPLKHKQWNSNNLTKFHICHFPSSF